MSDFLLEPPVELTAPEPAAGSVASSRPATLGGIDWAEIAAEARGEVALVEVDPGEGERQEWARRGDA